MTFILTGMHRSGTSMFARFMHESGIHMGEEFYRDESANKYGHYEDLDFLNLQRHELAQHFHGEDYLVTHEFSLSNNFIEKSKELYNIKKTKSQGKNRGWKDPRTTLFLNHWRALDTEARFIFMVRKPESVLNSLCRLLKTKWSLSEKTKYLNSYIFYNQRIISFIQKYQGENMAVVGMEKLVSQPEPVLSGISQQVDFEFDPELFRQLFDGRVMSEPQGISYFLLKRKLAHANRIFGELSRYFA